MPTFLDTDVLVDILRGVDTAKVWIESAPGDSCQVPGICAMELVQGCRNRIDLDKTQRFIQELDIVWPDGADFSFATEILADHCLSTGMGIPDALIAAMVMNRSGKLFTFNTKHFQGIEGLTVELPYVRPS